jgi:hypothetical protein
MATDANSEKKSNKKGLFIGLILALLATNGLWVFFSLQQKNDIDQKTTQITEQTVRIDSLHKEFELKIQELDSMKKSILALGGDTTRLGEQIRQMQVDLAKASRDARVYKARYAELQRDIDLIKANGDKEIKRLTALLAQQDTIIVNQKVTIDKIEQNISKLNQEKEVLQEKVTYASVLRAEGFLLEALTAKGKVHTGTEIKSKYIDKLRISFQLAENKVADVAEREVTLRVIEPDGSALYELSTGGGEFTIDGKQLFYTLKTNVLYDKKVKKVGFEYRKGSAWKKGTHTFEIYCEGQMIGQTTMIVR